MCVVLDVLKLLCSYIPSNDKLSGTATVFTTATEQLHSQLHSQLIVLYLPWTSCGSDLIGVNQVLKNVVCISPPLQNLYDSIKNEPFKIPEDDGNDLTHTFFNPDREGWLLKLGMWTHMVWNSSVHLIWIIPTTAL